jgi:hypothetical protein
MLKNIVTSLIIVVIYPTIINLINKKFHKQVDFNRAYFIKLLILFFVSFATLTLIDAL